MANRKNETIYPENDNEFTKKEPLIRGGVQLEYKANEEFGGMGFLSRIANMATENQKGL